MNCFAIVPAAGQSLRMGEQHKLLLPWRNSTVIDHVLRAWASSRVTCVVAVVRPDDLELRKACQRWPTVDLVIPDDDPEDMKRSIQLGLQHIAASCTPKDSDRWMVAPADLPTLDSTLIDQVIDASADTGSIVVPRFGDCRGHPVSFPWSRMPEVFKLADDQGINSLVADHPVRWLDLSSDQHPYDIDTPEDYARLLKDQKPL